MAYPLIMLGGVPIVIEAGSPQESIEPLGGSSIVRMSNGAGVKMTHWERMSGTISGTGWMPPGLEGLDYSGPLELRCRQVNNIVGNGPEFRLVGTPRPDQLPWAYAHVNGQMSRTACAYSNGVATVATVAGAERYQVCWMPIYSVYALRPARSQGAEHGWSLSWEEV